MTRVEPCRNAEDQDAERLRASCQPFHWMTYLEGGDRLFLLGGRVLCSRPSLLFSPCERVHVIPVFGKQSPFGGLVQETVIQISAQVVTNRMCSSKAGSSRSRMYTWTSRAGVRTNRFRRKPGDRGRSDVLDRYDDPFQKTSNSILVMLENCGQIFVLADQHEVTLLDIPHYLDSHNITALRACGFRLSVILSSTRPALPARMARPVAG